MSEAKTKKLYHATIEVEVLVAADDEAGARRFLRRGPLSVLDESLSSEDWDLRECPPGRLLLPDGWNLGSFVYGCDEDVTVQEFADALEERS